MFKYSKNQSGVVILYALLMIALITAIGIGVSVIIIRELRLTQNTHYATLAYYAADSGVERALYTVKVSRDEGDLSQTITKIRNYNADQNGFVNNASYSDIQTSAEEERIETNLEKDQITQFDLYDIQNPTGPSNINSLKISWSDGTPSNGSSPWLEISYIKWDPASPYIDTEVQSSYKLIYSTADLVDGSLPVIFQDRTSAYRVRLKALYDTISNLVVTAYDCPDPLSQSCTDNEKKNIPARVIVKSVGKMGEFEQAITALVPWNIPLFGLYDYVLYSEGQIEKKIIVGAPIYTSGAIEVEEAIKPTLTPYLCEDCANKGGMCGVGSTCQECGWSSNSCICHASCDIAVDSTGTCKLNASSTFWSLPIPSSVSGNDKYYLSIRANYTGASSGDRFQVKINRDEDNCTGIPDQGDGYITCTIDSPTFELYPQHCFNNTTDEDETGIDVGGSCPSEKLIGNSIQFEFAQGSFDIDWYQLSTYKIFDDCKDIMESCPTHPTIPLCGDNKCEPCETCFPGDQDNCPYSQACRVPRCSDGICDNDTFMDDDSQHTGFCDGIKKRCCSGTCIDIECDDASHCNDANSCTADTCINGQTCTADCNNDLKCDGTTCSVGSNDWCNSCTHSCGDTYCNCGEELDKNSCKLDCCPGGTNDCVANNICYSTNECHPSTAIQKCSTGSWVGSCGDGTCNCGEDTISCLADCPPATPPDYEYLRYIAFDESGNNLTSLPPSGLPGKSQRSIPAWQDQTFGSNFYRAVSAADTSHIWVAGNNGVIVSSDDGGQNWTNQTTGISEQLNGIWTYYNGFDYEYWAVGNSGRIHHCTSGCTTATPTYDTQLFGSINLNGIHGVDDNNIWAVGINNTILYYNGAAWSDKSSGASNYYGVWAYDTDNVWVVGDNGTILNCSGTCANPTWNPQTSNSTYILTAISGTYTTNYNIWISARSSGFLSTAGETILYSSDGTNWIKQNNNSDAHMYGISAYKEPNNEARAIVTGLGGNTFYYNGSGWSSQITGSTEVNRAVYAYNWQNIWVTGETGVIIYANAPSNGIVTIGNGYEQYWLSKQYSSFNPINGDYWANLNITRNTTRSNRHVYIRMSLGYCNNGCDEAIDFIEWLPSISQEDINGSGTGIRSVFLGNGDFSCTDCRLWYKIWASQPTSYDIDISVSGREATHSVDIEKNSYIDIP